MFTMAILLVATTIMSSHELWFTGLTTVVDNQSIFYTSFNCPALCLVDNLKSNIGGDPLKWTIVNLVLLVWAYSSAMIPLFNFRSSLANRIREAIEKRKDSDSVFPGIERVILMLIDFLMSNVFNTAFNVSWFALGVVTMVFDRLRGRGLLSPGETENSWGFGQIVPLLLIFLPFLAAIEIYYGIFLPYSTWFGLTFFFALQTKHCRASLQGMNLILAQAQKQMRFLQVVLTMTSPIQQWFNKMHRRR